MNIGDLARAPTASAAACHQVSFAIERCDASRIAGYWAELEPRADITFFLSWLWIGTWIEQAGLPDFVLVGRSGGEIVCLGLLRKRTVWRHGLVRSRTLYLHQTGDPEQDVIHIEHNGFLCDRRFPGLGGQALAFFRRSREVAGYDEFQVGGVTEALHEEALGLGRAVQLVSRKGTALVDLRSIRESGRDYLATLSNNSRYQIKRAIRIYEARGPLSVQPARSTAEALEFLDRLGELHEETWRRRGPGGAWRHPFLVSFHRSLVRKAFPQGGIDIVRISCGEQPIGYLYCLVRDGWIGSYLSGFAYEEDNKVKPGLVSFYLYVQHKLQGSGELFDFLAGDQRYKTSLGQPGPVMHWFRIQERRPQLILEQGIRDARKRILGLARTLPGRSADPAHSSGC